MGILDFLRQCPGVPSEVSPRVRSALYPPMMSQPRCAHVCRRRWEITLSYKHHLFHCSRQASDLTYLGGNVQSAIPQIGNLFLSCRCASPVRDALSMLLT